MSNTYRLKMMGRKYRNQGYEEDGYYIRVIQQIEWGKSVSDNAYQEQLDDMTTWCALSGGHIVDRNTFRFEAAEEATMFMLRFT